MPFYEIIIEPKQKGWNIKEHYRIMAAYFLVHSMCWCISLLALACAWDKASQSTDFKEHYRTVAAYFLVHSMCWCISLLALACAWDKASKPTNNK